MAGTGNNGAFQRALARFKGHLSPEEQEKFGFTTLEDVQQTIAQIQSTQESKGCMMNLTRLKGFIEAMEQYGKIVEVFLNVSDIIAFVWGPVKLLIQIASTWVESFDVLLDAYEEIGENIPQLLRYGELFERHAHMRKVLELMYGDILEFHRRALKFFSRPTWRQLFRSSWKTFRAQFQYILTSLSRHKHLVESQASLVEFEQSNAARVVAQSSFEDAAKAERLRRLLAVTEKIHPPNTLTDHEGLNELRQEYPASGRWILKHPFFRNWKDLTCPLAELLWINGIPGAGKTVIASLIIEVMENIDSIDVAFFYCKYNDDQKSSFTNVLRGILVQLVQQNEDLLTYIYDACCSSSEVTMESPSRLKHLVETSLRSCSNACIIIDGVDECEEIEEKKIIAWLTTVTEKISKDGAGTIRVLFISQRDKVTENLLTKAAVISLDSEDHQEDIQTFARHWSKKLQQKFGISGSSASQIGTDVATQAKGLFLFAKLVLTHLYSQTTRAKLFAELQPDCFPAGLDAAYERIALRIFENPNQSEREDAHNIFRWIICAKRPLKWSDIQSVFAIDPDLHRVDSDERQLRVTCRDLCGSLVETCTGDILELVHQSAKLYLIKTTRISVASEDLHVAGFCVDYLNFKCFDANLTESEIRGFLRQGYYSFEDYAIAHWLDHVDSSTSQPLPLDAASFERLTQRLASFFFKHGLDSPPDLSVSTDLRFHSIRDSSVAKRLNVLGQLVRQRESNQKYLDLEHQLQRRRSVYENIIANADPLDEELRRNLPLNLSSWFKCSQKHCDAFFDGFSNKKDRDKHISQHERPFRCSFQECLYAKLGYATEKELKRHEKSSHPTGENSEWAFPTYKPRKDLDIFSAAKKGDLATVKRLVEEGADVNQTTNPKGHINALVLAVRHDHSEIVEYLSEKCDPVNDDWPVRDAIRYARNSILQMILEKRADPTRKDLAQEALFDAARYGREELIPLLLTYGIDINQPAYYEMTALDIARNRSYYSFAQSLIKHGALDETAKTMITDDHNWQFNSDLDDLEDFDFEDFGPEWFESIEPQQTDSKRPSTPTNGASASDMSSTLSHPAPITGASSGNTILPRFSPDNVNHQSSDIDVTLEPLTQVTPHDVSPNDYSFQQKYTSQKETPR